MVQNVNPTFVKTPNAAVTVVSTGTTGATASLYTGGTSGSKISSIVITANTSSTQDVRLALVSSAGSIGYFNTVSVATNSGLANASAPVNGFTNAPLALDSDGNPFLLLNSTAQSISAFLTTNSSLWAAGSVMNFIITAGDF